MSASEKCFFFVESLTPFICSQIEFCSSLPSETLDTYTRSFWIQLAMWKLLTEESHTYVKLKMHIVCAYSLCFLRIHVFAWISVFLFLNCLFYMSTICFMNRLIYNGIVTHGCALWRLLQTVVFMSNYLLAWLKPTIVTHDWAESN